MTVPKRFVVETTDKPRNCYPAMYWTLIPWIQEVAEHHGYAITVLGSLQRDLDLVAIPWRDEVASPKALVEALVETLQTWIQGPPANPVLKPHGRLSYSLVLSSTAYIDLSVMIPAGDALGVFETLSEAEQEGASVWVRWPDGRMEYVRCDATNAPPKKLSWTWAIPKDDTE